MKLFMSLVLRRNHYVEERMENGTKKKKKVTENEDGVRQVRMCVECGRLEQRSHHSSQLISSDLISPELN